MEGQTKAIRSHVSSLLDTFLARVKQTVIVASSNSRTTTTPSGALKGLLSELYPEFDQVRQEWQKDRFEGLVLKAAEAFQDFSGDGMTERAIRIAEAQWQLNGAESPSAAASSSGNGQSARSQPIHNRPR